MGFPSLHLHLPLRCHADVVSQCPLSHGGAAWAVGQAGLAVPSQPHVPQPAPSLHRPDGLMYQMFRNQFLSFSMYQSKCAGTGTDPQVLRVPAELCSTWETWL